MRRTVRVVMGVTAAVLVLSGSRADAGQPEVNNPPEIKEFSFDFGVKAGNLLGIDTSEPRACTRVKVNFKVEVVDYEGDLVIVTMDLDGDKKLDDAKRKVKGAGTVQASRTYSKLGPMQLRFKACDSKGACSSVMRTDFEVVACPPAFADVISSVEMGQLDKTVNLTLTARDVQDDRVTYEIDWDEDMEYEVKTKPSPPDKAVKLSHTYDDQMIHWVNLRVCDSKDGCSEPQQRKL